MKLAAGVAVVMVVMLFMVVIAYDAVNKTDEAHVDVFCHLGGESTFVAQDITEPTVTSSGEIVFQQKGMTARYIRAPGEFCLVVPRSVQR